MVGEIRDPETAQIAIQSALTGHLVFTTVHANNVFDVLGRFLNMGVEPYQFISALNCVMAQRLVRKICEACKQPVTLDAAALAESAMDPALLAGRTFYEGAGCIECGGTGFKGRMAICELLDLTDHIREIILDKTADLGSQARRERAGHAVASRVGGRAGARRADHAAGDQQGDVRRMSLRDLLQTPAPDVAVEIDRTHVAAARLAWRGGQAVISAHVSEPLPAGLVVPGLAALNMADVPALSQSIARALSQLGGSRPSRVSLIVPDTVAKVSLLKLEQVPPRASDLREIVRWQIRKTAPFPLEQAVLSISEGARGAEGGSEFIVAVSREDVIHQYEQACLMAGVHAGLIDLSTFGVINSMLANTTAPSGDWLLVHVTDTYLTLAVDARQRVAVFPQSRRRGGHARGPDSPDGDVLRGSSPRRRLRARADRRRGAPARRRGRGAARPRGTPQDIRGVGRSARRRGPAGSDWRVAGTARRAGAARRRADARTEGGVAMLRTNLSTRPFYNERAVRVALGAVAALAIGLTLFNAYEILRLQGQSRDARQSIAQNEAQARELRDRAQVIRRSIDKDKLAAVQAAAHEANALIDRRTFSWTELLNQFQATLPPDVRIGGVTPQSDDAGPAARADFGVLEAHRGSRSNSWTRSRRPARSPACCRERSSRTNRGTHAIGTAGLLHAVAAARGRNAARGV